MDEKLSEIEKRASKADGARERLDVYLGGDEDEVADCYDTIAESAADVPRLLAEVRRLWAELDRAEKGLLAMSAILAMKG